jgi:hypothetical protein
MGSPHVFHYEVGVTLGALAVLSALPRLLLAAALVLLVGLPAALVLLVGLLLAATLVLLVRLLAATLLLAGIFGLPGILVGIGRIGHSRLLEGFRVCPPPKR